MQINGVLSLSLSVQFWGLLARGAGLWGLAVPPCPQCSHPILGIATGWGCHCKALDLDRSPWGCPDKVGQRGEHCRGVGWVPPAPCQKQIQAAGSRALGCASVTGDTPGRESAWKGQKSHPRHPLSWQASGEGLAAATLGYRAVSHSLLPGGTGGDART